MIENQQAHKNSQPIFSIQPHDIVLRSVKLFSYQDGLLSNKALSVETTKNKLIGAAIILKCEEWKKISEKPLVELAKGELENNQDEELIVSMINLTRGLENDLRMIAYKFQTTTNSLIRSAVGIKLEEWSGMDNERLKRELSGV